MLIITRGLEEFNKPNRNNVIKEITSEKPRENDLSKSRDFNIVRIPYKKKSKIFYKQTEERFN